MATADEVVGQITGLSEQLRLLNQTLSKSAEGIGIGRGVGTSGVSPREANKRAEQQVRLSAATKDLTKAIGVFERSHQKSVNKLGLSLESYAQLSGKLFNEAINQLGPAGLDKLPKELSKEMSSSTNTFIRMLGGEVKTLADAVKMQKRLINIEKFEKMWKEYQKGITAEKFPDFVKDVENLGFEAKELDEDFSVLRQRTDALALAMGEASRDLARGGIFGRLQTGLGKLAGAVAKTATVILAFAKPWADAQEVALRTGTRMAAIDAALMGMSPETWSEIQAEFKTTMLAAGMGYEEFAATLKEGQGQLFALTGNMRDAARVSAHMIDTFQMLGDTTQSQEQFTKDQTARFDKWNAVFSMTAETFVQLNENLLKSVSVQGQLLKISRSQRAAFMQGLQDQYQQLRMNGLLHEEAEKMLEVFAAIGAKSPRERLKEAAKMQAVMGAMGMGGMGAEAAELVRGGLRDKESIKRFGTIMGEANEVMAGQMQRGFAQEMVAMQLVQMSGMDKYLGPGSEFGVLATRQGKRIDKEAAEREQEAIRSDTRNHFLTDVAKHTQIATAFITGPLGQNVALATVTLQEILGVLNTMAMGSMVGGIGGKIAGAAKGLARLPGAIASAGGAKAALGIAGKAAGGVGLAALAGAAVGTLINKTAEAVAPEFHRGMTDFVGEGMANVMAFFGSETAKHTLEMEATREASAKHQAELTKEAMSKNIERLDMLVENSSAMNEKMDEQTKKIERSSKKTTDAVKEQTDRQEEQANEQRGKDTGYRVMWRRSGTNAASVNTTR